MTANVQRMVLRRRHPGRHRPRARRGRSAAAVRDWCQGLLFGVARGDPATLAVVAVIMTVVDIGACWIPAARAARIEPGDALRAQCERVVRRVPFGQPLVAAY